MQLLDKYKQKKKINENIKKQQIAYLCSLALFFSYIELFIPKIIPFFKFGFANIAILLALPLNFCSVLYLSLLKAICVSCLSGTLFTPFVIVSIIQSLFSAFIMKLVYNVFFRLKNNRFISLFGISVLGSVASCVCQIFLFNFYLGFSVYVFLGPMLIFSIITGIITAFVASSLIKKDVICSEKMIFIQEEKKQGFKTVFLIKLVLIFIFIVFIFMNNNLYILLVCTFLSLIIQRLSKRKIFFIPYFFMWLFVCISCLLVPEGKVLFEYKFITISQAALLQGVQKSLKLTSAMALSQSLANMKFTKTNSIFCMIFAYNSALIKRFENSKGEFLERIINAL